MSDEPKTSSSRTVQLLAADESIAVPLPPAAALLVGRNPDIGRLSTEDAAGSRPQPTAVPVPTVSINHLLVRHEGERLIVRDLASKNGSWLRLPPNVDVTVDGECTVRMGALPTSEARDEQPADATWTDSNDFARAVVGAINEWLTRRKIPARASLSDARTRKEAGTVPLADGRVMRVNFQETIDATGTAVLEEVWRYVERQNTLLRVEDQTREEGMILASPGIRRAHARVIEAARRGMRLLLMGPSGSGKEGLARCYHRRASAGGGPFVARNCSTLRGDLLRSELFGAEAGSFTGCVRRIIGAIERAQGGTLFLDEIGDMTDEVQPMLLRFLDDGEFERLGSYGVSRSSNVNIVCATNRDLRAAVQRGAFRADLWYRLSIEVVEIPPLRERHEDVVAYLGSRMVSNGTTIWAALDEAARALLATHSWDGNFRELANFAMRVPHDVRVGEVDRALCLDLLSRGAVNPRPVPPPSPLAAPSNAADTNGQWMAVAERAIRIYVEDYGVQPTSWDDLKNYVEKYLKPLLFAHLSGATACNSLAEAQPQALASRLDADRGTALKHLTRYFERFAH